MKSLARALGLCLVILPVGKGMTQVPLPFQDGIESPSMLAVALRDSVIRKGAPYPFRGFRTFGRDSALLVFEDSTMRAEDLHAHTWMFGPPVTAAEADSCPPEKVLGRKIARVFWRGLGKPTQMQYIMIAVVGTKGIDRWTTDIMYFHRPQLDGRWAGDPGAR